MTSHSLTTKEHKALFAAINKNRLLYQNALNNANLDERTHLEHRESLRSLDSALVKINHAFGLENQLINTHSPKRSKLTHANARILIAEDNADSANLLTEVLQDMGFKLIDHAQDGKEAFDKIKSSTQPYDLILCDWDMPEVCGLEVYSKALASNTLGKSQFMMVTAVSEANRIREAIQRGVNSYIVKPIDVDILENKILSVLNISE